VPAGGGVGAGAEEGVGTRGGSADPSGSAAVTGATEGVSDPAPPATLLTGSKEVGPSAARRAALAS